MLHAKVGVLHRNIAFWTILINPDGKEGDHGMLTNFTMPFMSEMTLLILQSQDVYGLFQILFYNSAEPISRIITTSCPIMP
jgi:hypothetical protein